MKELARGFNIDVTVMVGILDIPSETPGSTKIFDLEEIDESLTLKNVKIKILER